MFKQLPSSPEDIIETIEIELNGEVMQVSRGLSVASVMLSQGQTYTRTTPVSGSKRAPYCMMGVCYDCLMIIDGQANQRACSIPVENGMRIETQLGVGSAIGNKVR